MIVDAIAYFVGDSSADAARYIGRRFRIAHLSPTASLEFYLDSRTTIFSVESRHIFSEAAATGRHWLAERY